MISAVALATALTVPASAPATVSYHPTLTLLTDAPRQTSDTDTGLLTLQITDAEQSARCFHLGCYETDPMMKPFSHGGTSSMILGFALQDAALALIEPHLSRSARNVLRIYMTGTEGQALVQTSATIRRYDR